MFEGRPGENLSSMDLGKLKDEMVEEFGDFITNEDVMSAAMYPKVTGDYLRFHHNYGPVDKLDTPNFLMGPRIAEEFQVKLEPG